MSMNPRQYRPWRYHRDGKSRVPRRAPSKIPRYVHTTASNGVQAARVPMAHSSRTWNYVGFVLTDE